MIGDVLTRAEVHVTRIVACLFLVVPVMERQISVANGKVGASDGLSLCLSCGQGSWIDGVHRDVSLSLHLSGWIPAPVLAKVDPVPSVLFLDLDALDGFDGVSQIGKVDKGTIFLSQRVDEFDLTPLAKVSAERVFGNCVVDVAHVDVSAGACGDCECDGGRQGTRVFAPPDLQPAVVDRQSLHAPESGESMGSVWVDKGDKADMLVGNVTDVMQDPASHHIADLFERSFWVNVAEVDGSVVVDVVVAHVVEIIGVDGMNRNNGIDRMSHERRVSVESGTAISAIVDTCGCPSRFQRQLGNGLDCGCDGKKVAKGDSPIWYDSEAVDRAESAEFLDEGLFGSVFRQAAEEEVPGC